jgi:hypothetical protein
MAMTSSSLRHVFEAKFSPKPVEQQRRLVEAFREAVKDSGLAPWEPGYPIPDGTFVLVGVMVGWNTYDQELAAALDEAVADGRAENDRLAVIAADHLTSREAVEAIFPGLRGIGQSPFVGLWEGGQLRVVDSGPSATAFLSDRYGLRLP